MFPLFAFYKLILVYLVIFYFGNKFLIHVLLVLCGFSFDLQRSLLDDDLEDMDSESEEEEERQVQYVHVCQEPTSPHLLLRSVNHKSVEPISYPAGQLEFIAGMAQW